MVDEVEVITEEEMKKIVDEVEVMMEEVMVSLEFI